MFQLNQLDDCTDLQHPLILANSIVFLISYSYNFSPKFQTLTFKSGEKKVKSDMYQC